MATRSEADKMLDAFEQYYALEYTPRMRQAMREHLGMPPKEYLLEVYKLVIEQVEARWNRLPDLAAVMRVQQQLPEAFTFASDYSVPQLTDDAGVDMVAIETELAQRQEQDGEPNHEERERIRRKVAKGEATKYELFWIRCIDEFGGDWRRGVRSAQ